MDNNINNSRPVMEQDLVSRISAQEYGQCYWQTQTPSHFIARIREAYKHYLKIKEQIPKEVEEELFNWFCSVTIHYSNRIEDTGLPIDETRALVQAILRGDQTNIVKILDSLAREPPGSSPLRDVVQHAQAFRFLCVENRAKPLTVDLIKETHKILMTSCVREDGKPVLAGEYRQEAITIGRKGQPLCHHDEVPANIQRIVDEYTLN